MIESQPETVPGIESLQGVAEVMGALVCRSGLQACVEATQEGPQHG